MSLVAQLRAVRLHEGRAGNAHLKALDIPLAAMHQIFPRACWQREWPRDGHEAGALLALNATG